MARVSKKQSFIGIAEIGMQMMKKEKSDNVHYNLHSIFSVVDHYLIAQCLDVSMTSRICSRKNFSNNSFETSLFFSIGCNDFELFFAIIISALLLIDSII